MNIIKKECYPVLVPTDKPSKLGLDELGKPMLATDYGFELFDINNNFQHKPQHLYILLDEEIKEGDLCIVQMKSPKDKHLSKVLEIDNINNIYLVELINFNNSKISVFRREIKKLIATTNPELNISHKMTFGGETVKGSEVIGLARISDEFIQQWVKNPVEKVMVEFELETYNKRFTNTDDNGVRIDSNEWGKTYNLKINSDNTINCSIVEEKEKLFTKSEVEELCRRAINFERGDNTGYPGIIKSWNKIVDYWIKENLK
ncbi:MAG TPA: hypothetical protein VF680_16990 [Allosphingosinicella sp.]|jgi:hypothetical protein